VGTEFDYITREGFGWMNASYQLGLSLLPDDLRAALEAGTPPEELF
jgi:alpha,alpha-trehalase